MFPYTLVHNSDTIPPTKTFLQHTHLMTRN